MTKRWWRVLAAVCALGLLAAACGDDGGGGDDADSDDDGVEFENAGEGNLLATIQERGNLICGVNDTLPGFGLLTPDGEHEGFDVDTCKAVAAAIFGTSEDTLEFVDLTSDNRFTALQSGDVDILIRNTTLTASRDGAEGLRFGPTTFYDGQGFMVPASSDIQDISGLADARICVLSGTTTELNLTSFLSAEGINFEPVVFETDAELQPAYEQGQCEAWTTDRSALTAFKSTIEGEGGEEQRILDAVISKEPLGPSVLDGEEELAQVMDWVMWGLFQAEEFGITQDNVEGFTSDDPNVERLLGREDGPEVASSLGLDPEWVVNMISDIGNYGEIYSRHLDPLGLEDRGVNAQYTDGGLIYAPPYR